MAEQTNLGIWFARKPRTWYDVLIRAISDAWDAEHARLLREDPYRGDEGMHRWTYREQAYRMRHTWCAWRARYAPRDLLGRMSTTRKGAQ